MTISVQLKRGVAANRPTLLTGELYAATDTNQVSLGPTPIIIGAPIVGTVSLPSQTAAKTATTLFTPQVTGFYRVSVFLKVVTALTGASAGPVTITYLDGFGSVAQSIIIALNSSTGTIVTTTVNASTTTGTVCGSIEIYAKAGVAVQYAIGQAGAAGSFAWSAALRAEAL